MGTPSTGISNPPEMQALLDQQQYAQLVSFLKENPNHERREEIRIKIEQLKAVYGQGKQELQAL